MVKNTLQKITPPLWAWLFVAAWLPFQISDVYAQNSTDNHALNVPLFKEFQGKVYVTTTAKNIMLGERITLTIKGENLNDDFEKIDWSPVKRHFKIDDIDVGFNRIKVRLYPFDSGTFTFPSQQSGHILLPKLTFHIADNPHVSIQWTPPPTTQYIQQNTTWKTSVWVQDSANKISLKAPQTHLDSNVTLTLSSLAIPSITHANNSREGKTEVFIASYQVSHDSTRPIHLPHPVTLASPVVVIKNRTNQKWFFFDRSITASILPLPHFLPATTVVGQLKFSSPPLARIQEKGALNYWTWQLSGQNMSQQALKQYMHQLIETLPYTNQIEWLSESHQTTTHWTDQGIQSTLTLRLPYRITQAGWIQFPQLSNPFFNPITGKLESLTPPSHKILVLPSWTIWMAKTVAFLLGLIALFWVIKQLKHLWIRLKLIHDIKHAADAQALWSVMQQWAQTQHTSPIKTLGDWTLWYHQTYGEHPTFNKLITQLNQQLYSDQSPEWEALKQHARQWSKQTTWWPARKECKKKEGGIFLS